MRGEGIGEAMGEAKEQALNWGIDNAWDALEELLGKYGARGLFEVSRFMTNRRFEAASIKVLFNDFLDLLQIVGRPIC